MSGLHVVHRCVTGSDPRWEGYLVGHEAVVTARSLPHVRRDLERILVDRLAEWPSEGLTEHAEHDLGGGMWVRECLDEHALRRAHTTRVLLDALADPRLREQLVALPETLAGGVVVISTVGGDTLDWIRDQHDGYGTLVVANALTNHRLWWNALTPPGDGSTTAAPGTVSLTDLELNTAEGSIDEWIAASECGRHILADTLPAEPAAGRESGGQH
ncbi:hypothetical protein SAMN04487905_107173 [Actinopolyspora xinjiangensis]|uniref:Uncharacterized protein n=1 Tax=Actinopolyspora xinjiangensis TaxID=405564 RepID=A0A1H0UUV9_9ACTN|nr:hypothetical protein [Actinopolyspora xinjiangensis]SDP69984.1 hypothetical protein SAMN04487905_107173 [Actinopolyspora xinjiangensis]